MVDVLFNCSIIALKSIMAAISSLMWATCHWSSSGRVSKHEDGQHSRSGQGTQPHPAHFRRRLSGGQLITVPGEGAELRAPECAASCRCHPFWAWQAHAVAQSIPIKIFQNPSKNRWSTNQNIPKLPSGYVKIAIENGPVEIVDFPMKECHVHIFNSYVSHYQRVRPKQNIPSHIAPASHQSPSSLLPLWSSEKPPERVWFGNHQMGKHLGKP